MRNKVLALILIMIPVLFGCKESINDKSKRNDKWAWWVDAKTGHSSWIKIGAEGLQAGDGRYTRFYFNGNVYEKGKLKDGKNVDTIFNYNLQGKPQGYTLAEDSSPKEYFFNDGPVKVFCENCSLLAVGIVKNHTFGSKWIKYFRNGHIEVFKNLKSDTGWATAYYENGKVKDSDYYEGENSFNIKHWYENGNLASSTDFRNHNYNGLRKQYYSNGRLKVEGTMVDGRINGKQTNWYESGKLQSIGNRKNNKWDGYQVYFYESGKIKMEAHMTDGQPNGEMKLYDEAGKVKVDRLFKNGEMVKDLLLLKYFNQPM